MNKRLMLFVLSLGLMSLATVGCDILKSGGGGGSKADEEKKKKEEESDEEKEEGESEEEGESAEVDIDEEDYIEASVQTACVDMELGDSDEIEMDKVEEDIFGKIGIDEETFEKAEEKFSENDEVSSEIESRLEDCTKETARKYAGLKEEKEDEKDDKPQPKPEPKNTGTFKQTINDKAGFGKAIFTITVSPEFKVNGSLRGKREGKGFRVPFSGKVSKSNSISAQGSEGSNKVKVEGDVTSSGASVEVSGTIWGRDFTTTMTPN